MIVWVVFMSKMFFDKVVKMVRSFRVCVRE